MTQRGIAKGRRRGEGYPTSPMPLSEKLIDLAPHGARDFVSTHWSVVLAAGRESSPDAQAALGTLCGNYWPEDAADLTQEFFSRLMTPGALAGVDRAKGRFRSFLLGSMRHLIANEWNRAQRQKRGGGSAHFSLDALAAEERYELEPADDLSPDKVFERRWAEAVLDRVTRRLQEEFTSAGIARRFDELKVFLLSGDEPPSYAESAARLEMTEGAVRTAIHRMRQRYGELFREEIAQTVASPQEVEEELRHFVAVLAG
jgi:RNA polymerase sigma factor (sigma-70 family)